MEYILLLSGENLKLSKFELETLTDTKAKLNGKLATIRSKLNKKQIIKICERSAMIKRLYIEGKEIWRVKKRRFEGRLPNQKPAFHPTALKPKLARLLVNISCSNSAKRLLDPFCGTGSVLIEAGKLNLLPAGSDADELAIKRAEINLKHYRINAELHLCDATKLSQTFEAESLDAIATDPPYGRSSKVISSNLKNLYKKFLLSAHRILKPSARLAIILPNNIKLKSILPRQGFNLLGSFDLYVHKSLTRNIVVLEKC